MDKLRYETYALAREAALLFQKREALRREMAAIDQRLSDLRIRYRDATGRYGTSVDHFEQACRSRGLL